MAASFSTGFIHRCIHRPFFSSFFSIPLPKIWTKRVFFLFGCFGFIVWKRKRKHFRYLGGFLLLLEFTILLCVHTYMVEICGEREKDRKKEMATGDKFQVNRLDSTRKLITDEKTSNSIDTLTGKVKKTCRFCSFPDKSITIAIVSPSSCLQCVGRMGEKPKNVLQFTVREEKTLNFKPDEQRAIDQIHWMYLETSARCSGWCLCAKHQKRYKRNSHQNKLPNQFNNRTK